MTNVDHILQIWCPCGHGSLIDTGGVITADHLRKGCRCSACGRVGGHAVIRPTYGLGSNCDPLRDYLRQQQERGLPP